ncbi:hypothetical protein P3X46_029388 [Hevea brasiliensis]|uniref:DJ-1/PfpI domain-containing protein n=1 Tax=Hevea brasiliensis TaxID=3981 RepID=A0ABQ9KSK1_HEVBR|nr:hypothetical protein P3X46_029388 [Hevea brasiliensis]
MVPLLALQAYGIAVDAACPGKKASEFCRTAFHDAAGDQTYSEKPETASYDELDASSYDALFIPAGQSLEYLALDETVLAL